MVNWVQDIMAENILGRLRLTYTVEVTPDAAIDRKTSRANTARRERLDHSRAHSISESIKRGDPIPFMVLVRKRSGNYCFVIAGGNHRDEACVIAGVKERKCYVTECNDAEFTNLCRMLNTVVGEGSGDELKIEHAADAVQSGEMNLSTAAREYCVPRSKVTYCIRQRKAHLRLQSRMSGKKISFPKEVMFAIADIQADAVFDEALVLVKTKGVSGKSCSKIIRDAIKLPTEDAQIEMIRASVREAQSEINSVVSSPKRKRFLSCISQTENCLAQLNVKALSSVDISKEDELEVRLRCKTLANILNSL